MIKVMHVCSDTNIGGAGRYLLNLVQEADKTSFELLFIVPEGSKLKALLEKENAKVIEAAIAKDQSFNLKDIGVIKKLIQSIKPDILHTHASLSARIAGKLSGLKSVIYTRHYVDTTCLKEEGQVGKSFLNTIKDSAKRKMNNSLCDGVIGVAKECEPVLLEMGIKPDKIKIIPNGVVPLRSYLEDEKEVIRKRYGLTKSHQVITIMARLSKEKGHEVFVEVIEKLSQDTNTIKGLIVGTGKEFDAIKKLIQDKNLSDKIIMTGFVENVEALLNITTVQMNTSYTEAQSLALSEGMSIGVPAVVTNAGGNPSMIRHGINGYVAPVGNVEALSEAVKALLEDEKRYETMSQNAKKVYEEHYTGAKMTRSTEAFYKEILNKNK